MAKRKKQLSVGRILALKPLQLEKMSAKELRQLTTILNSAANKRVKRAQTLGTESRVIEKAIQGGHFRTTRIPAGTPESEARPIAYAEFMRARTFLSKDTSSTRGVKKQQKRIIKKFKKKIKQMGIEWDTRTEGGPDVFDYGEFTDQMSEKQINDMVWSTVDKLSEAHALTKEDRYRAAAFAYEIIENGPLTKEDLFDQLEQWYKSYNDEDEGDISDEEIAKNFRGYSGI